MPRVTNGDSSSSGRDSVDGLNHRQDDSAPFVFSANTATGAGVIIPTFTLPMALIRHLYLPLKHLETQLWHGSDMLLPHGSLPAAADSLTEKQSCKTGVPNANAHKPRAHAA
ncbi:unnamed protein product [Lota lota]